MTMQLTILGSGDAFCSGGRYNTCLKLDANGASLLIDMGASAMLAIERSGLARNAISTILFTHFHGDHFAGIPFFLLDACFVAKRSTPLTIAGPRGVEARVRQLTEALYPGILAKHARFALNFVEVSPTLPACFDGIAVNAFPMVHDDAAGPCQGYRVTAAGRTFAFTGDTGWTDALVDLARDADLFLTECCFVDLPLANHLNWRQLEAMRGKMACKRMIVTHMAPDMLAYEEPMFADKAHDGLKVTV